MPSPAVLRPHRRLRWAALAAAALAVTGCTTDGPTAAPELTWARTTLAGTPRLNAVWGTSTTDVWAVGFRGAIHHYDGRAWTRVPMDTLPVFRSVHGTSATDVWVAGATALNEGTGLVLHFDGTRWTETRLPGFPVWKLRARSATDVFAVSGFDGALNRFDGSTWTRSTLATAGYLYGLEAWPGSSVIVAGTFGQVYRNELAWTQDRSPSTDLGNMVGIWGRSWRDLWIGGDRGQLLRYDGTGWQRDSLLTTTTSISALTGAGGTVWAVTTSSYNATGAGFIARHDGERWRVLPDTFPNLFGAWAASAREVWVVGDFGLVLRGTPAP